MKKSMTMLEDLWVAVAFAEAGIYDAAVLPQTTRPIIEPVRIHAA